MAYAYAVDDVVEGQPLVGVALGFADLERGGTLVDGIVSPEDARRLGEQLLAAAREWEDER